MTFDVNKSVWGMKILTFPGPRLTQVLKVLTMAYITFFTSYQESLKTLHHNCALSHVQTFASFRIPRCDSPDVSPGPSHAACDDVANPTSQVTILSPPSATGGVRHVPKLSGFLALYHLVNYGACLVMENDGEVYSFFTSGFVMR